MVSWAGRDWGGRSALDAAVRLPCRRYRGPFIPVARRVAPRDVRGGRAVNRLSQRGSFGGESRRGASGAGWPDGTFVPAHVDGSARVGTTRLARGAISGS